MPMLEEPIVVVEKNGKKHKATLFVCDKCDGHTFAIFEIETQDHPHYQCANCDMTFCGTHTGKTCTEVKHGGH